jgi:hypothetical protein
VEGVPGDRHPYSDRLCGSLLKEFRQQYRNAATGSSNGKSL